MIKEMNCCMIQCNKCLADLEINNDTMIIFSTKEKLIEMLEELGWVLLETGEAICKSCLGKADKLSAEEKHCIAITV
jgi:hypothetical protein